MFFPKLTRKNEEHYHNSRGVFYATYGKNYSKIESDCKGRCVYCDITRKENGGDEMSLDHFRPKDVFIGKFKIIEIHPYNLYLSCQKCNVLKSNDWHGCKDTIDGATYNKLSGYIDRFSVNVSDYLTVEKGEIIPLKPPVEYMIKKMHLNRPNRVYFRYLRELEFMKKSLEQDLNRLMRATAIQVKNSEISQDEFAKRFDIFTNVQGKLAEINF